MNQPSARTRRRTDAAALILIGLLALSLRLAVAVPFARHPLGRVPWVDEGAYLQRALAIRQGAWRPAEPFYQDPLYPYFLAGLATLAGPDLGSLRIAQACLGSLTPVILGAAGAIGLSRGAGLLAGLGAALCGPLVATDVVLDKESPGALVAALALLVAALGARSARPSRLIALAGGLAWGGLSLLRSNALLVAPMAAAWWRAERPDRTGLRRALASLLGIVLVVLPVLIGNWWVGQPREWLPTTWQAGPNFYIGNGPEATGTYTAPRFVRANPLYEAGDFTREAARRLGRPATRGEVNRYWLVQGLRRWADAPGASLALFLRKVGLVLHHDEIPDNQNPELIRLVAAPALGGAFVGFGLLVPLAAGGSLAAAGQPLGRLALGTSALGLLSTALFFVVGRYRVPWIPGLLLVAAAGVATLPAWIRECRFGRLGMALVLALVGAGLAWRTVPDPAPARWSQGLIQLAATELQAGHVDAAIDALDDARALDKTAAEQVRRLLQQGPLRGLLEAAVAAERVRGTWSDNDLRSVRWLRNLPGTRDESRQRLEALQRERPDDPLVRREMAAWWLGAGDDPEARAEARRQLAGPPADVSSAILGSFLRGDPSGLPASWPDGAAWEAARLRLARRIVKQRAG